MPALKAVRMPRAKILIVRCVFIVSFILIKCICSEKKDPKLFVSETLNEITGQLIELLSKLISYSINKSESEDSGNREENALGKNIF